MIEAVPRGLFSGDFSLHENGLLLTELDVSSWRGKAEFEIGGTWYRLYREGLVTGAFLLESDEGILAHAAKPSFWRDRFEVELAGRSCALQRPSIFGRRFGLFESDRQIGEIHLASPFTRRTWIDFPPGGWQRYRSSSSGSPECRGCGTHRLRPHRRCHERPHYSRGPA